MKRNKEKVRKRDCNWTFQWRSA